MVEQLLEAGRWAPSASNRQPWHFIVVRDEKTREAIAQQAAYHFIGWAHIGSAPLLIVLCGETSNPVYRRFLGEDIGLAGGHIMLQAHALGLGTCWIGGIDPEALGEILRVPDHVEVVGLLTVGFPAEDPAPRRRKPLSAIAHYDSFGSLQGEGPTTPGAVRGGLYGRLRRLVRTNLRARR
jgi:nitroreductase